MIEIYICCEPHSDLYKYLYAFTTATQPPVRDDPCAPSPCGPNAQCNNGQCTCIPEYQGDPYVGCRPECVLNSDCARDRACVRNKCIDPCPGTCGTNAICIVNNHVPMCHCPDNMSGNAFFECRLIESKFDLFISFPVHFLNCSTRSLEPVLRNPCQPSPCGPNSQCRELQNVGVCSCLPDFIGSPPQCRPECTTNSDCPPDQACQNSKCRDPCPGTCGFNAVCNVVNHNPFCTCRAQLTGNPFVRCQEISKLSLKFSNVIIFII